MSQLRFAPLLFCFVILFSSVSCSSSSQAPTTSASQTVNPTAIEASPSVSTPSPIPTPTTTATATPHPTLVRYPFLQIPRPDGVTIVWATRDAGIPWVFYGQTSLDGKTSGLSTFYDVLGGYYQHEVALSGLTPGSSYRYQVLLENTQLLPGGNLTFRTAPAAENTSFSFIAFADSGVTGSSVQLELRNQMMRDSFDLAIIAGDVSEEEGTYDQLQRTYFEVYKDLISRIPFMPVAGDDEYTTNDAQPFLDLFVLPRNGALGREERFYSFDYGNAHFVALDSESLGPTQTAWLDADLAANKKFWTIVYFQRTPFGNGNRHLITGYGATRVRTWLLPVIEKYRVNLVFAGNNHVYGRTAPLVSASPDEPFAVVSTVENGGVVYITTGGAGDPVLDPAYSDSFHLPPGGASLSIHHYVKVVVNDCSLTLMAIDTSGMTRDEFSINRCG